jgi:Xaa-Pro dipeptidase
MDLTTLFRTHIAERQKVADEALAKTGFDTLVISSGEPFTHFADDQEAPHHTTPHFAHWTPLKGPHHVLVIRSGKKPRLMRYAPEDFWYEQTPLGHPFWADCFEIQDYPKLDAIWSELGNVGKTAYIGNEIERAAKAEMVLNPARMVARLDWHRAYKTDYEVQCIADASILGAKGHEAGRKAFLSGASELEIHYAFVQAVGCLDHELAFSSIVALDPKGATLHYENKRTGHNGRVLLLDCGARVNGYASDITRTTAGPGCHERFKDLIAGMEKLELELCASVKPDLPFGDLHHNAHLKIAALLKESGILKTTPEESVAKGLTRPFMPHGLGHHLGIQVHDVGGKLANAEGELQPSPEIYPSLRTTRTLEARHLVTIEPGLYFIPMLLKPFRENEHASHFQWKLIDELTPFGGIRIEDDVLATEKGPRNLTRECLPN